MAEQLERSSDLRAADGRVPGRRGRATRQRLLDCTAEMLRTTSYRSVKVIDIAREAGTSPATFYQYFADVEAAILVLAQEMALDGERLVRLVAEGSWKGKAGYRRRSTSPTPSSPSGTSTARCCGWSTSAPRRATGGSATSGCGCSTRSPPSWPG